MAGTSKGQNSHKQFELNAVEVIQVDARLLLMPDCTIEAMLCCCKGLQSQSKLLTTQMQHMMKAQSKTTCIADFNHVSLTLLCN